ncbi:type II 3-dehydroquinate dehydratase [Nocardioides mangrovicus]|nr:type II 3-dehydroquinate dehydratase [Nocardioides mangrovicus]
MRLGVLQGSNLNRLGRRDPAKYGTTTLAQITEDIDAAGRRLGFVAGHVQSNHEGVLVDWLHEHGDDLDALVLNPAGFTSTGYPLLDACKDSGLPLAVVHISAFPAIDGRERTDVFAPYATVYLTGAGPHGYRLAAEALLLRQPTP